MSAVETGLDQVAHAGQLNEREQPEIDEIPTHDHGHGLAMLIAPTNVVIVGGLTIAKVGDNRYLRFVAPLFGMLAATIAVILFTAATLA